jgi:hypothetical protein
LRERDGVLLYAVRSRALRAGDETPGSVNGELAGGVVMSLMTGRDSGIVIAVASNMAHANTSLLALRVGDAFAAQTR